MKITNDKTESRQAYLTIEMEPAEIEEGLDKAYKRLVKKYNVPGFRKGKTPRLILEQYLGKEAFLEDAVEHMAPEVWEKAVKEQDIKAIARPEVNLDKTDPVTYKFVVPLEPVVKLGDYETLRVARESVELKEEDIDAALEQIRRQQAIWEPVDRQVNSRDLIMLDIESNVEGQPYINQDEAEYEVIKESEYPIKGFAEEMIGLKNGESKEFKLKFADDYNRAELAGKEVSFKVTINEIKQERLPELNDDLAQQVNPEFKTVADMRSKVSEDLKRNAEEKAKRDYDQKVVDSVVELSEVEYPPVMEEMEIDQLIQQQMQRWRLDEKGMDAYLQSIQKTGEQLRDELRPLAVRSIRQSLVLTEVAQKEKIQVEQTDLQSEVEGMTKDVKPERKEKLVELLNVPQMQANLASSIATRKTVEKLTQIASSPAEIAENNESAEKSENAGAEQAEAETKEEKE
ncbi:MAG: trigger factor [Dehalococcoidales bacterium]|nr:trigger factor [Dehalococcoidales bacterium]